MAFKRETSWQKKQDNARWATAKYTAPHARRVARKETDGEGAPHEGLGAAAEGGGGLPARGALGQECRKPRCTGWVWETVCTSKQKG